MNKFKVTHHCFIRHFHQDLKKYKKTALCVYKWDKSSNTCLIIQIINKLYLNETPVNLN